MDHPLISGTFSRSCAAFVAAALASSLLGACAPRVFHDGTTIAIVGSAPPPPPVVQVPARIELREKIQFAKNSDRILEVSHAVLDEAVTEIQAHPQIRRIRVEGHASADGKADHNLDLSARRARAVRAYLVAHGIAEGMLDAEGFGSTQPVADNETAEGREANRRVELRVIEVEQGAAVGPAAP